MTSRLRKFGFGLPARVALVMAIAGACAFGQGPGGARACEATAPWITFLRSSGLTEMPGDLVVTCPGYSLAPDPVPGALAPVVTLTFTSNLPFSEANNTAFPLLLVGEPGAPHPSGTVPQLVCTAANNNCPVTMVAKGQNMLDGTPGRPNVFVPTGRGAYTLTFANIPYFVPQTGALVLRLTNVRLNASFQNLATVPNPVTTMVQFTVSNTGAAPLPIPADPVLVALNQSGMLAPSVRTPDNAGPNSGFAISRRGSTPRRVGVLRFGQGLSVSYTAFRTRQGFATYPVNLDSSAPPVVFNLPGVPNMSMESSFYNPALVHPTVDFSKEGLADGGRACERPSRAFRRAPMCTFRYTVWA